MNQSVSEGSAAGSLANDGPAYNCGLILGKFLPPHRGHLHLIDSARRRCRRLVVVLGSLQREPIPGELRVRWLREIYPADRFADLRIEHCTDENPQYPEEHPDFWNIWKRSLERFVRPDVVFTSEAYGVQLAQVLGCKHEACDPGRAQFAVSGTAVREAPLQNWDFIPETVRPYFAQKILLTGPESVGKTTLARRLAEHFQTDWSPEYAREYIDRELKGDLEAFSLENVTPIACGQVAQEARLLQNCNRVLFCDTDLLVTRIYSEFYLESCPEAVRREAALRDHDLTLMLDIDTPWVPDHQRDQPERREWFRDRFCEVYREHERDWVWIRGSWEERFQRAVEATEALLARPMRPAPFHPDVDRASLERLDVAAR